MKIKIFAVHDVAADAFLNPHFFQTTGMAIRAFANACKDPSMEFHQHPSDYTLFEIGSYDPQTGQIDPITPHAVSKALDFSETAPLKAVNDG